MRAVADGVFAKRHGHRAIVLETVAAVPGMVGASMTHLRCLRRMCDDQGWIRILMEEAENEPMHLMTFIEVAQLSAFEPTKCSAREPRPPNSCSCELGQRPA